MLAPPAVSVGDAENAPPLNRPSVEYVIVAACASLASQIIQAATAIVLSFIFVPSQAAKISATFSARIEPRPQLKEHGSDKLLARTEPSHGNRLHGSPPELPASERGCQMSVIPRSNFLAPASRSQQDCISRF